MLFLDTNVIVYYLHGVEPYATTVEPYLQSEELVTSLRVIDETLFTLVRMKAWRDLGVEWYKLLPGAIERNIVTLFHAALTFIAVWFFS